MKLLSFTLMSTLIVGSLVAWAGSFTQGSRINCQGVIGIVVTENVNGDSLKVGIQSDDGQYYVFNKSKCH